MPQTYRGNYQRALAGRYIYGASGNYRLSRVISSVPNILDKATIAPTSGEAPLLVTATIPAKDVIGPVALSGDVAPSSGTRPSWTKETIAGVVNVTKIPFQGGYASAITNVALPIIGDVAAGTRLNAVYPRVAGATEVTPTQDIDVFYGDGNSDLNASYNSTPTNTYAAGGTYDSTIAITDGLGRSSTNPVGTVVAGTAVAPTFIAPAPAVSNILATSADADAKLSEAGTIYVVVVLDGAAAPTVANVIAGVANGGGPAVFAGNVATVGNVTETIACTPLVAATAYDVYFAAEDAAGNDIAAAVKVDLTTAP